MGDWNSLRYGRMMGIGLVVVSLFFLGLNYFFIRDSEYYLPKFLYVGTIALFLGVSLLLMPGGDFTKSDIPSDSNELMFLIQNSDVFAKAVWVVAIIIGIICGFFIERMITNPLFEM